MAEKPKRNPARKPRRANLGGRPPYAPSIEDRTAVEQMKYCGESDDVIARSLKIDANTLRKHFEDELADGHAARRKEIIGKLFEAAKAGNVSAQKKLEEIGRAAGAAEAVERRGRKAPEPGKKEQQQAAAERVAGKFAPPAAPKLVVDNR